MRFHLWITDLSMSHFQKIGFGFLEKRPSQQPFCLSMEKCTFFVPSINNTIVLFWVFFPKNETCAISWKSGVYSYYFFSLLLFVMPYMWERRATITDALCRDLFNSRIQMSTVRLLCSLLKWGFLIVFIFIMIIIFESHIYIFTIVIPRYFAVRRGITVYLLIYCVLSFGQCSIN